MYNKFEAERWQDEQGYESDNVFEDDEEDWRAEEQLTLENEIAEYESFLDQNPIGFEDCDFDEEC